MQCATPSGAAAPSPLLVAAAVLSAHLTVLRAYSNRFSATTADYVQLAKVRKKELDDAEAQASVAGRVDAEDSDLSELFGEPSRMAVRRGGGAGDALQPSVSMGDAEVILSATASLAAAGGASVPAELRRASMFQLSKFRTVLLPLLLTRSRIVVWSHDATSPSVASMVEPVPGCDGTLTSPRNLYNCVRSAPPLCDELRGLCVSLCSDRVHETLATFHGRQMLAKTVHAAGMVPTHLLGQFQDLASLSTPQAVAAPEADALSRAPNAAAKGACEAFFAQVAPCASTLLSSPSFVAPCVSLLRFYPF